MPKTRTFLGIAASGEVVARAQQVVAKLARVTDNIKWVEPDNLHWTLHFLGEIDDQEIYQVCRAADRAASASDAFSMQALGLGAFPAPAKPKTIWLGAGQGSDELAALHAALDEQLSPLGFRGETRKYVPHLTLGRAGRGIDSTAFAKLAEAIDEFASFDAGLQQIDEVTVYASRLDRVGPEYSVLGRAELG